MNQLQIEHEGYLIRWNDDNRGFEILNKETEQVITRKSFRSISDAEIWVNNHNKTSYNRVPILAWNNQWSSQAPRCPGEATSPVDDDQAWLSFANPKSRYKQYMNRIWLDTPDNRRILEMVNERKEQVKTLKHRSENLKNQPLSSP